VVIDMSISVRVGLTSPDQLGFGLRTIWLLCCQLLSTNGPELT